MKKKIIFLMNSLEHGGTERVVTTLADSIKKKYDVKIYTLFDKNTFDVDVKTQPLLKIKNHYLFFLLWPIYILRLKKAIRQEQPDMLISFLEFSNLLNIVTKKRIKTIISTRSHVSNVYKKRNSRFIFLPLIKHFYKKADTVLVNSKSSKTDLIDNFNIDKNKIEVIYNPVDIKKIVKLSFEKIEHEYNEIFSKKNIILVTLGRLSGEKAHKNLLKIIKHADIKNNVKLVIIGDGILKQNLAKWIAKWDLNSKIILLGDKKNPFKYLKKSNIFVFTSFYEGMPNAMLEAMTCGLPVLSVDCKTGPREILSPNTNVETIATSEEKAEYGILCPPFNQNNPADREELSKEENIFKKTLENLINSPDLLKIYSKKSKKRASNFDKDKIVKEFIKFIEKQTTEDKL